MLANRGYSSLSNWEFYTCHLHGDPKFGPLPPPSRDSICMPSQVWSTDFFFEIFYHMIILVESAGLVHNLTFSSKILPVQYQFLNGHKNRSGSKIHRTKIQRLFWLFDKIPVYFDCKSIKLKSIIIFLNYNRWKYWQYETHITRMVSLVVGQTWLKKGELHECHSKY